MDLFVTRFLMAMLSYQIDLMSAPDFASRFRCCHHDEDDSAPAIVFEDVHLAFGDNEVLRGVSFHLPRGETKALFGVAGSGKSMILKLALGLIRPDSGRIIVLGQDITQMREEELFALRGKIGMVFQESALFDSLTVRENVAYRLIEEHGVYDEDIDRRVLEALRFVELEHTLDLVSFRAFRRHAAPRGHRARDDHAARSAAL